jgi:hypothetical protein
VRGRRAGKQHTRLSGELAQRRRRQTLHFLAADDLADGQPDAVRDRLGGQPVVAGQHHDADAGRATHRHRILDRRPWRIPQRREAEEGQVSLDGGGGSGQERLGYRPDRDTEQAEAVGSETIVLGEHRAAVRVGELPGSRLPSGRCCRAPGPPSARP